MPCTADGALSADLSTTECASCNMRGLLDIQGRIPIKRVFVVKHRP